jgi:hypothetical protein
VSEDASGSDCYFLSYSRSDERFALRFAKDLRGHGVAMWIDQLDIRPSEHWDRAIERAVRDCRGLVVILSPRSVASENVADEISYAIDTGKSVLPVMIEKCTLPLRITRMHMVDATAGYDRALKQCVTELKRGSDPGERAPEVAVGELDPEAIATAKQQLISIIGPIAGIVVDKEARRAGSVAELYSLLTSHIENEADRERFVALTSRGAAPAGKPRPLPPAGPQVGLGSISAADLKTISEILTAYIGPIAPIVTKRESQASGSLDGLCQRLAALVPTDCDRAEFVGRLANRLDQSQQRQDREGAHGEDAGKGSGAA